MNSSSDVGAELRQARERRGFSIEELADRTKISRTMLKALEGNDAAALPGWVFTRGFITAYAREVGLDADEAFRRYAAQFEPELVPVVESAPSGDAGASESAGRQPDRSRLLAIVAVVGLALALYVTLVQPPARDFPRPVPAQQPVADVEGGESTATAGSVEHPVLRVEIAPVGACWVSATADGVQAISRLMQPGERATLEIRAELVLRVGDAAAFAFTIDEAPGRPLGAPAQVVDLRITPQNYREYLR